jgi:hypothetical protein
VTIPHAKPKPRGLLRLFLKVPPLLYQRGFARRLGPRLMLLTTTGRTSGLGRTVGLNYARQGDTVYVISGFVGQTGTETSSRIRTSKCRSGISAGAAWPGPSWTRPSATWHAGSSATRRSGRVRPRSCGHSSAAWVSTTRPRCGAWTTPVWSCRSWRSSAGRGSQDEPGSGAHDAAGAGGGLREQAGRWRVPRSLLSLTASPQAPACPWSRPRPARGSPRIGRPMRGCRPTTGHFLPSRPLIR